MEAKGIERNLVGGGGFLLAIKRMALKGIAANQSFFGNCSGLPTSEEVLANGNYGQKDEGKDGLS